MTWLVECKAWSSAVPKEKVFALRTIVEDTGADRGFVMAEKGYQSGALEAARLTNVMLTSRADLSLFGPKQKSSAFPTKKRLLRCNMGMVLVYRFGKSPSSAV
jgi:hypothetical protein